MTKWHVKKMGSRGKKGKFEYIPHEKSVRSKERGNNAPHPWEL